MDEHIGHINSFRFATGCACCLEEETMLDLRVVRDRSTSVWVVGVLGVAVLVLACVGVGVLL